MTARRTTRGSRSVVGRIQDSTSTDWTPVRVASHPKDNLIAPAGPPVRACEILTPVEDLQERRTAETVVDMGQNMVGWVRLDVPRVRPEPPSRCSHAEVLDKDGNFYTENLRARQATDRYTLKGGGVRRRSSHTSRSTGSATSRSRAIPAS